MLHGKIFRSTVAHGRIKSIDTSAAQGGAGVHRVVTVDDVRKVIPEPYYGPAFHDQPILAIDKVRYVGEPVAVVLAADPHVAEEAAQLIVAEYEELPAVFDEVEAMTSNVSCTRSSSPPAPSPTSSTSRAARAPTSRSISGCGAAMSTRPSPTPPRCSSTRSAPRRCCTCRSSRSSRSPTTKDTGVTIYTASQGPSFVRTEIARLLGWPENRVRIKVPYLGGGFGAKLYIKLEALVTALSMIARRPVKVALTMEEQFYTITKHPARSASRAASTRTAASSARKCEVYWNGGAYADIGPRVTQKSGFTAPAPTTSTTSGSIPTRSTPTCRRPARCAASAFRSWCGPMRATPT